MKICGEINRSEDRRMFGWRSKETQNHKQDLVQEEECWDSEEFDMSDNDYESPDNEEDDSYICAMSDHPSLQPPVGAAEDNYSDEDYELPPSSTEEIPRFLNPAQTLENPDYIDSVRGEPSVTPQAGRTPRPPQRPTPQAHHHSAPRGDALVKPPLPRPNQSNKVIKKPPLVPQIDRSKKPGRSTPPMKGPSHQYPTTPVTPTRKSPQLKAPESSNRFRSSKPPNVDPTLPFHPPSKVTTTKLGTVRGTDMDPGWYGGLVTRGQAEAFLRQVNKDAAFLVRDSSKGSPDQPYTLMVLSQDKVYNIQIRRKGNTYQLGTGLMGSESFPGVKEMIEHFKHTPLLLIDAMERGTGVHQECCLLHPGLLS
ncbi:lymphocyte cytosolic protein 2 isoform X2 [Esox lucius]|nr:lymphocyte cytosolic protein 2 isoform X2 [Esox lucius]